jgi:hypothetical protein
VADPGADGDSLDTAELQARLLTRRTPALAALSLSPEFVLPDYSLCIGNLPATLAALLGGELGAALPPLPHALWRHLTPQVRRVVCVILDAVGWLRFRDMVEGEPELAFADLVRSGQLVPLTSVFPSTTTSALTTLWTGYAPAQHGVVGHNVYLRAFDETVDTLGFCPAGEPRRGQMIERGLIPEQLPLVPGLAEVLADQGIVTRTLIRYDMAKSALSRLCFRGVSEVRGIVTAADMWVNAREILTQNLSERLLLVVYWGDVDAIGHLRGPDAESWRGELRNLSFSLGRELLSPLTPRERDGTVLVITSDHGQIAGNASSSDLLTDHPSLEDCLRLPPTGAPRSAYLFVRSGRTEEVRAYIREHLVDRFQVADSSAVVDAELLGPGQAASEARERVGDLTLLARGVYMLDNKPREERLLGMHGGLSPCEMLVPLLTTRLG